jgi:transposase
VTQLHQDPLAGDCFLVVNRLRTRAKVLLWDGTGLCVYHKRLDQGRFAALCAPDGQATPARTLTLSELSLFLEGCTLLTRTALSPGAVTPRQWTPRLGTSA